MATTRYTATLRLEYANASDRDKIYEDLKAMVSSAKALAAPIYAQIQKEEYNRPELTSEIL